MKPCSLLIASLELVHIMHPAQGQEMLPRDIRYASKDIRDASELIVHMAWEEGIRGHRGRDRLD